MHIKWSISIRLLMSLYKRYFEKHDGAYIKASLYSCRPFIKSPLSISIKHVVFWYVNMHVSYNC